MLHLVADLLWAAVLLVAAAWVLHALSDSLRDP